MASIVKLWMASALAISGCAHTERFDYRDVEKSIPGGVVRVRLLATDSSFLPNGNGVVRGPYEAVVAVDLHVENLPATCEAYFQAVTLFSPEGRIVGSLGPVRKPVKRVGAVPDEYAAIIIGPKWDIPYVQYVAEVSISIEGECLGAEGSYNFRETIEPTYSRYPI